MQCPSRDRRRRNVLEMGPGSAAAIEVRQRRCGDDVEGDGSLSMAGDHQCGEVIGSENQQWMTTMVVLIVAAAVAVVVAVAEWQSYSSPG